MLFYTSCVEKERRREGEKERRRDVIEGEVSAYHMFGMCISYHMYHTYVCCYFNLK